MKSVHSLLRWALPGAFLLLSGPAATAQITVLGELSASAGPDRFVVPPAMSVTLRGTVSAVKAMTPADPRLDNVVSIAWSQLSGPTATISGFDTLTPTITPSRAGSLRIGLKVVLGNTVVTDEVLVFVLGDSQDAQVAGQLRKWQKLSLTFTHNQVLSETSTTNPFLDLRLTTHFFNLEAGVIHSVPGFFAADGLAAETSATSGTAWRTNFVPDHAGTWYYVASFRSAPGIALDPNSEAGQPASFDGANGVFYVEPTDPAAPGFPAKGRLQYVGDHHLRFAETGERFLKGGAGSPENFLGYYEFDGANDLGGPLNGLDVSGGLDGLHHYNPHLADYADLGVPLWKNGKGRRIYGALNYLSSRGVDSLYALTFNIDGGDGQEVWPWVQPTDKLRFDVSRLAQWERVIDHMTRAGIVWHVITQEFENDHALDGGALGQERSLYYRELVARFGHALGLVWNLGEENTNTPEERRAFADYIREIDPWDHPITIHNVVGDIPGTFGTLLGTHLELLSIQGDPTNTPPRVRQLVLDSAAAGRPWVVNFDEQTPANDGVVPDVVDFWHDLIRRESLWPTLLGQGGGCEWYFGYGHPNDDLDCEDFRSRENLWLITRRALDFLREHVPFFEMQHADALATGNGPSVLAKRGEHYLVYLPFGGPTSLNLEGYSDTFVVSWFDARNGGALQNGVVTQVAGPGLRSLGSPPGAGDWVAYVRRAENFEPVIESLTVEPGYFEAGHDFTVAVHAADPNGPTDELEGSVYFLDPLGNTFASAPLTHRGGSLYSYFLPSAPIVEPGTWEVVVIVEDEGGLAVMRTLEFQAQ